MHTKSILVVDDSPVVLQSLGAQLAGQGYRVLPARDAVEAVRVAQSEHPDLALVDLFIPGLDGIALARRLKADPATRTIPLIAMTAHPLHWSVRELKDAGFLRFLAKPLNLDTLLPLLARHLPGPPTPAEPRA